MQQIAMAYGTLVLILSLIAFAAFGFDKRRSRLGGRRVPEKTLHIFALLGGWPGALTGQRYFRHKTQKLSFRITLWACIFSHLTLVGGILYLLRNRW